MADCVSRLKYCEKRKCEFLYNEDEKKQKNVCLPLSVREPRHYQGYFNFSLLEDCGDFSVDGDRTFVYDKSQLKYIHLPEGNRRMELDLNVGYELAKRKLSITDEKLDFMLKWILAKYVKRRDTESGVLSTLLESLDDIDFICYRGLLKVILTTPYERRDDWMICATKFKGKIYLVAFPTERRRQQIANMTDMDKKMCSWGYKFEQYLTKDCPDGQPEPPSVPVNENEEYCVVFKSKLNDLVMMYGAEIDGISNTPRSDSEPPEYIELKTSRVLQKDFHNRTFLRHKTLNWWAQSFLASVKKIRCGFRDDGGVVQYIRSFSLHELVDMGKAFWHPEVCFNFANNFLLYVKSIAVKDDPNVIYQFQWKPGSSVTCKELHSTTSPEFQILPMWYISEFET